jgi:Transposase, Mutator family
VLADGRKELLALELGGSESGDAWREFVADLQARGLRAPLLAIIDGNPGLRQALSRTWPATAVQRCAVHKLRNLARKAPKHALRGGGRDGSADGEAITNPSRSSKTRRRSPPVCPPRSAAGRRSAGTERRPGRRPGAAAPPT